MAAKPLVGAILQATAGRYRSGRIASSGIAAMSPTARKYAHTAASGTQRHALLTANRLLPNHALHCTALSAIALLTAVQYAKR